MKADKGSTTRRSPEASQAGEPKRRAAARVETESPFCGSCRDTTHLDSTEVIRITRDRNKISHVKTMFLNALNRIPKGVHPTVDRAKDNFYLQRGDLL